MNEVPQRAGLYWARHRSTMGEAPQETQKNAYTMIVRVTGESPFLRARAFYFYLNDIGAVPEDDIKELIWGPEIVIPAPILHRQA